MQPDVKTVVNKSVRASLSAVSTSVILSAVVLSGGGCQSSAMEKTEEDLEMTGGVCCSTEEFRQLGN